MTQRKKKQGKSVSLHEGLPRIEPNACGIDVGATEHWVAVPADRDEQPVRRFESFTSDLHGLADWLKQCAVETVAMESTGVYWIPLFQILEERGFRVHLVNAANVKNVTGRKSDITDCQWLQILHSYGLLRGSFRPASQICALRSYWRHRQRLIQLAAIHVQHIQKALTEMNLQLHNVISDLTGVTGQKILRAIVGGERDVEKLAAMKDYRIKSSRDTIAKSLVGEYRPEHVFALQQSLELWDFYGQKLEACDRQIQQQL